ncbi:unnamed protein product, partial [Effrenium voratum]
CSLAFFPLRAVHISFVAMGCGASVAPEKPRELKVLQEAPAPEQLTPEEVEAIFARGKAVPDGDGAALVHRELPAEWWGVGKAQLVQLGERIQEILMGKGPFELVNLSKQQCRKLQIPYYEESKFRAEDIGPNMYQVNEGFIRPFTRAPSDGIPFLSYALHCNPRGLLCDLFISHAWAEGVFELTGTVVRAWPANCRGAYICALANPQNLPELMSHLIQTPTASPFYRVLLCRPRQMLMVANCNVPIHSRLWCVFEAHCARTLRVPVAVVGAPEHFATNTHASGQAQRAIRRAIAARRRERAIDDAMESAAADMDIIAAGFYHQRYERWAKTAKKTTAKATKSMQQALDVRNAGCTSNQDAAAIRVEIDDHCEEINAI